uniref:Uncharacterized protein n=1 Tax=Anguilla anguilla TaxID=7936 RepID=A0A0E9PXJ9_ANGAN
MDRKGGVTQRMPSYMERPGYIEGTVLQEKSRTVIRRDRGD